MLIIDDNNVCEKCGAYSCGNGFCSNGHHFVGITTSEFESKGD